MYLEKSIGFEEFYYLKDDTLLSKLKEKLNIDNNFYSDLKNTPTTVALINDFFNEDSNIELFLESIEENFSSGEKPTEIIYEGVNSEGKIINFISFYFKYNLSCSVTEKIAKIKDDINSYFRKEFKNKGYFSVIKVSQDTISLRYGGYFNSDYFNNIKLIDYCNLNNYRYEFTMNNRYNECRFNINMVIKNDK